jgi:alcohol dehydrogenase class IV
MDFEFATATRIVFGAGKRRLLGGIAKSFGKRAFVVTGRSAARAAEVVDLLTEAQISSAVFHIAGEPTVDEVRRGAQIAASEDCDLVVGIGGGSALDGAKAVAALRTNPGDLFEYLEVVGRGQPLTQASAPCITIPTTAGTGAEVTRNSVLAVPEHRFKVSLRSPFLLAKVALVDPELSYDLPPALTASTGLDALTQLIEPYVSHRANPLTDGFCLEGLRRAARSLARAYENGGDPQARADMSLAALLSGLALASAALGAVHGFAAPLGGMYTTPHGLLCAALLPQVMAVNVQVLRERQPDGEALRRYRQVAELLTGTAGARAEDGIEWVRALCQKLQIPRLGACGIKATEIPEVVDKAAKASSMKGNPIPLTVPELREILEHSM